MSEKEIDPEGEKQEGQENEEEKKEEEDEETLKQKEVLNKFKEDVKSGLSVLSKAASNDSYAYIKLTLAEKEMDKLYSPIAQFVHLRYLDLSTNQLTDISLLTNLKQLVVLNLSKNLINNLSVFNPEADEDVFPFLQFLYLQGNKLNKLESISLNMLRKLDLSENEISSCEGFEGHSTLQYLIFRQNKLKNLKGLKNCPQLLELYLEENQITDFRDLQEVNMLRSLFLAKNQLKKIKTPFPYLPSLYHLNIAENQITQVEELDKIGRLKSIKSLTITANPFADALGEEMKMEILMRFGYFERINEEEIKKNDRVDAENLKVSKQLQKEEEERRKKQEEEDAKRLEEETKAQEEAQKEQQQEN